MTQNVSRVAYIRLYQSQTNGASICVQQTQISAGVYKCEQADIKRNV